MMAQLARRGSLVVASQVSLAMKVSAQAGRQIRFKRRNHMAHSDCFCHPIDARLQ